jgi:lipopolysaccharide/colanic/teichoic acid biosynthesis glycosyltransferase
MHKPSELRADAVVRSWTPEGAPGPTLPGGRQPATVSISCRKRACDIVVAASVLLLFLPLMLTVAILIRLESPGPALFRQRRTGLEGKVFKVLKFRTMTVAEDGDAVRQATRDDQRVTAIGAQLRRFSIDELPQLINVLRGEMSLIGPRPHALAHDEAWSKLAPDYDRRFRARPGLTGYAAVCGHRGEVKETQAILDRIAADNLYIDTWSFALDLRIAWRTLPLIFADERAY